MDQAKATPHLGIRQLHVKVGNLRCEQEALVNNRSAGERGDIEEALFPQIGAVNFLFRALADDVKFAFQGIGIHAVRPLDKKLLDVRLRVAGQAPDGIGIHRRVAPTQDGQAFVARNFFQNGFARHSLVGLDGKEDHPHAVLTGRGQRKTQAGTFGLEKRMRNLDQHAGAIARLGIAPASAAVRQVDQDFDSLHYDVVGFFAGDVGHKADPARVMFVARIVKTLRPGQAV